MENIEIKGIDQLIQAIQRNPKKVASEAKIYLTRGLAVYKRGIINSPWRIGGGGGGAPVSNDPRYKRPYQRQRSGNLRDTHVTQIKDLEASIGPNLTLAPYAIYVHEGTNKMQARPWLDWVQEEKQGDIQELYEKMLDNIFIDLKK